MAKTFINQNEFFIHSSSCHRSHSAQFPSQPSSLSYGPRSGAAPCWQKRRMHHLLRPGGGHGHLHLWPHVPVQRLRAEAQEADQRVLSHLQEAHQGRHQDVSAVMGGGHASRSRVFRAVVSSTSGWVGYDNLSGHEPNSDMLVPIFIESVWWRWKKGTKRDFLGMIPVVVQRLQTQDHLF